MYGTFFSFDMRPFRWRRFGRQWEIHRRYYMGGRIERIRLVKVRKYANQPKAKHNDKSKSRRTMAKKSRRTNRRKRNGK